MQAQILQDHHGEITAELTVGTLLPSLTSGNLQTVIYDLTNQVVYIAFGYLSPDGKKTNAYDRPYNRLDLKQMFGTKLNE